MSAPSSDRAYEIPKQMAMSKGRYYRLFAVLCAFDNDNLKTHVSQKSRWRRFFFFTINNEKVSIANLQLTKGRFK